MTTTIDTDTTTRTFEQIIASEEWDLPCEANKECEQTAEWVAKFRRNCECMPPQAMCCTLHKNLLFVATSIQISCAQCKAPVSLAGVYPLDRKCM